MKKHIIFVILTSIVTINLFSQNLKINNGLSFSSMNFKFGDTKLFNSEIQSYCISLGVDYLNHKYYYLSSEIGLIKQGGKEYNYPIEQDVLGNIIERWNYFHINTTFRIKYAFDDNQIYAGFGPKLDILSDSKNFNNKGFTGYQLNNLSFGFKPELGFNKFLNNNIYIGLNLSYLLNIRYFAKSEFNQISINTYIFMFSLGYNFDKKYK